MVGANQVLNLPSAPPMAPPVGLTPVVFAALGLAALPWCFGVGWLGTGPQLSIADSAVSAEACNWLWVPLLASLAVNGLFVCCSLKRFFSRDVGVSGLTVSGELPGRSEVSPLRTSFPAQAQSPLHSRHGRRHKTHWRPRHEEPYDDDESF